MRCVRDLVRFVGHKAPFLETQVVRAARSLKPDTVVVLDYPIRPKCRFGHDRPAHGALTALLAREKRRYAACWSAFAQFAEPLHQIPIHASADSSYPSWDNTWICPADAIALYGFLRLGNPRRYVEIGSGHSTKFARRAIQDGFLRTEIISFDPEPRATVDGICDRVVRRSLEDADLALFDDLEAGDVLFVDSSHRVFSNSDVTVLFLEILPRLQAGVLVHLHDIFLPHDYPDAWCDRYYSEQYLLAAYLLGGHEHFAVILANYFATGDREMSGGLEALWSALELPDLARRGGSFWMVARQSGTSEMAIPWLPEQAE